jgi:hypothetical protein
MDIFHHDLETIKFSFSILYFVYKVSAKFSLTIPSEAAKKARICLMKYFSSSFNLLFQSFKSCERSISSAVQN